MVGWLAGCWVGWLAGWVSHEALDGGKDPSWRAGRELGRGLLAAARSPAGAGREWGCGLMAAARSPACGDAEKMNFSRACGSCRH